MPGGPKQVDCFGSGKTKHPLISVVLSDFIIDSTDFIGSRPNGYVIMNCVTVGYFQKSHRHNNLGKEVYLET